MITRLAIATLAALALGLTWLPPAQAAVTADSAEDQAIAASLATMLRAARTVISANQARINDPALGPKGLDGKTVLAAAVAGFQKVSGSDPQTIDKTSRQGALLQMEMDAIAAVMEAAQSDINVAGIGFKGFIPAVFGRLVTEEFDRRAHGLAHMKVTAPPDRVRNRLAMPDAFETNVIEAKFLDPAWVRGTPYAATVDQDGTAVYRSMSPEYYAASCLSCHGGPKGSVDVTGYPREGFAEGDLGGVISIVLAH